MRNLNLLKKIFIMFGYLRDYCFFCKNLVKVGLFIVFLAFLFNSYSEDLPSTEKNTNSDSTARAVKVGFYRYNGFQMIDEFGQKTGYSYDYLNRLKGYARWHLEYVGENLEWDDMLPLLRNGQIDLLAGVSKTPEREAEFAFSQHPFIKDVVTLVVKEGNDIYSTSDYSNWNGIRIGVLKGSYQEKKLDEYANEHEFTYKKIVFEQLHDLVNALHTTKQVDAIATSSLRKLNNDEWICDQWDYSLSYIAVRKTDVELLGEVDYAMGMQVSQYPDLQNFLIRNYYSQKSNIIHFTPAEKAYLQKLKKSGRVFTTILNPDRKPFSWIENGEYKGICKVYADEISRLTGIPLKFVPVQTEKEYYQKRFSPEVDLLFDIIWDLHHAEKEHIDLSFPYFSISVSLLQNKNAIKKQNVFSVISGSDLQKKTMEFVKDGITLKPCDSLQDAIKEIRNECVDGAYLYTRCAEYAVFEDTQNQLISNYIPSMEDRLAVGVKDNEDPLLLTVLNHGIAHLNDAFLNQVRIQFDPEVKKVFSLKDFVFSHPLFFFGLPSLFLLILSLGLVLLLMIKNRHQNELLLAMKKWEIAASVAKIHSFQMNMKTFELYNVLKTDDPFWKIENGRAVLFEQWVYPDDLDEVKKAYKLFEEGKKDAFYVTYRAWNKGELKFYNCYGVKDLKNPEMMIGIIHDVTEIKKTQEREKSNQQMWKSLFEQIPIMIFIKSANDNFRYTHCNANFAKFVGHSTNEIVGHTDAELFENQNEIDSFMEMDHKTIDSNVIQKYDKVMIGQDHQKYYLQSIKIPFIDYLGNSLVIGISTDVTPLRKSRDESIRLKNYYNFIVQSIGDGVIVTDLDGKIQLMNQVAEKMTGVNNKEALGKPHEEVFKIISAIDQKNVESPLRKSLRTGNIVALSNHTDLLSLNGQIYHIADCANTIHDQDNQVIGAVLIFRDVTIEYQQKERLNEFLQTWHYAAQTAKIQPFKLNVKTRESFIQWEQSNSLWPVVDHKIVPIEDWVVPEDCPMILFQFDLFTQGRKDYFDFIYHVRNADNQKLDAYHLFGQRSESNPDIAIGLIQNVTESHNLQMQIEEQRNELQNTVKLWNITSTVAQIAPFQMHIPTRTVYGDIEKLNTLWPVINGKAIHPRDLIYADDIDDADRVYNDFISGKRDNLNIIYRVFKEGKFKYYRRFAKLDQNNSEMMIGIIQDITVDKTIESERDSVKSLWSQIGNILPFLFFVKDADNDFRYVQCNAQFSEFIGRPIDEIIGKTDFELINNQKDASYFTDYDRSVMNGGVSKVFYEDFQGAHKHYYFQTTKIPFTDHLGKRKLIGFSVDITEFRKAQKERDLIFNLWNKTFEMIPFAFYIKDVENDYRYLQANSAFYRFMQKTEEDVIGKQDFDFISSTEQAIIFRTSDINVVNAGKPCNFQELFIGENNKKHYFNAFKMIIKNMDGKTVLVGLSIDITDIIEQKQRLQLVKDQLELGTQMTKSFSFVLDENHGMSDVIGSFKEIWPHQEETPIPVEAWIPQSLVDSISKQLMQFKNDPNIKNLVLNFYSDWYGKRRFYISRLQRANEFIYGITTDITELVVKQNEMQEMGIMWQSIINILPVRFFIKDIDNELRYLMVNKKQSEFMGKTAISLIGQKMEDVMPASPEMKFYLQQEQEVLKNPGINKLKINLYDAKNILQTEEIMETKIIGLNNKNLLIGMAFDIKEREQNLKLSEFTSNILANIVLKVNLSEILTDIGQIVLQSLKCRRIFFIQILEDETFKYLQEVRSSNIPKITDLLNLQELQSLGKIYLSQFHQNKIIYLKKIAQKHKLQLICQKFPEFQNFALGLTPIFKEGKLSGLFVISFDHEYEFSSMSIQFMRSVANCIALAEIRFSQNQDLIKIQEMQAFQLRERQSINNVLSFFMNSDYMNVPFKQMLEIIRNYLGASNCYLLLFDMQQQTQHCVEEALADDQPFLFEKTIFAITKKDRWYTTLENNKIIIVEDVSALSNNLSKTSSEYEFFKKNKISSFWGVPLYLKDSIWGFLGITYNKEAKTRFNLKHQSYIYSISKIFSLIFSRINNRDELINTKNELVEALTKSQVAEKAKSYFFASMSHEIRTPLNAVIGFSEMMKDAGGTTPAQKEYIENISVAGNALLQLINDILDLSKLEAEKMVIIPEKTDFYTFCHEIFRTFLYSAGQKNIKMNIHISKEMPHIMIDHLRMRQIFFNLIGNAIKFTPNNGHVDFKVNFTPLTHFSGVLIIKIIDSGIGISEEDKKNIFEPFVQLSKMRGTNASNNGTGLGLPIVRRLVDKMDGILEVESEQGRGTTFTITLSNIQISDESNTKTEVKKPLLVLPDSMPVKLIDNKNSSDASKIKSLHVLIVDDVKMNVKIFSSLLTRMGISFNVAYSGAEALSIINQESFDWILTDFMMPEMNGDELTKIIRRRPDCQKIKIAVITAENDFNSFDKNLFDVILFKPVGRKEIENCLLGDKR